MSPLAFLLALTPTVVASAPDRPAEAPGRDALRADWKRYIAAFGSQAGATDPMFGTVRTNNIDVKAAACSAELKRVIERRAKAAKLSPKRVYVK